MATSTLHSDLSKKLWEYATVYNPNEWEATNKDFYPMILVKESNATPREIDRFLEKVYNLGYSYSSKVPIDKEFLNYAFKHICFGDWLKKRGYIKKRKIACEPKITIKFKNFSDLFFLYHRLNLDDGYLTEYIENYESGRHSYCSKYPKTASYVKRSENNDFAEELICQLKKALEETKWHK